DGEFLRSVVAFDVEGWIGLRVAEPLRFAQAFIEAKTILLHARKDVVAGAVQDSINARERTAVEALAQRLDDGDAAGHRGLEVERNAMSLGHNGEPIAMAGEQRLVGGYHRLAGGERGFHDALGRIALPADHFDQDIDPRIGRKCGRIGKPAEFLQVDIALLAARTRAHRDDLDRATGARREFFAPAVEQPDNSQAYRS